MIDQNTEESPEDLKIFTVDQNPMKYDGMKNTLGIKKNNKHQVCLPCKILGTILKMYEEISQTNGLKDTKIDEDSQEVTPKR